MSSYSSLLQETETAKLVQLIVENAPIGIYTINKTGAIEFANPKFLEISGDSETELIGLNAFTSLPIKNMVCTRILSKD